MNVKLDILVPGTVVTFIGTNYVKTARGTMAPDGGYTICEPFFGGKAQPKLAKQMPNNLEVSVSNSWQ